jgi:hypothetical protein
MPDALQSVATVSSEPEAEMIRDRLLAASIHAIAQRTIGGPEWGYSGAREVLVDAKDLDHAREVLASDEGAFSDDELARLSEEASREANEP